MLTTRHPVAFAYTPEELQAMFAYARQHDVEQGGRYDARAAAITLWSHHWGHPVTRHDSEVIGAFYVRWAPTLYAIECEEGFSLDDLLVELGHVEEQAWGRVIHAACIWWEGAR
jgi:hypothetical protein